METPGQFRVEINSMDARRHPRVSSGAIHRERRIVELRWMKRWPFIHLFADVVRLQKPVAFREIVKKISQLPNS